MIFDENGQKPDFYQILTNMKFGAKKLGKWGELWRCGLVI